MTDGVATADSTPQSAPRATAIDRSPSRHQCWYGQRELSVDYCARGAKRLLSRRNQPLTELRGALESWRHGNALYGESAPRNLRSTSSQTR
jgi:hypothetical protein